MKNRTLFFGEGLFETFRVYAGRKLAFVEDHLDRMAEGCRFFAFPFYREKAIEALKLALNKIPHDTEARLRLNLIIYGDHSVDEVVFQTTWEPLQEVEAWQSSGVKLALAPFQRLSESPVVRFKTTSYLENIFVFRWARRQGFFDALFTNERGEITEGSITNVFFLSKGRIFTPPTDAGLLPGVTRKQIIKVAGMLGFSMTEAPVMPTDLNRFDGAFVTNSVIEILPVCVVHNTNYKAPEMIEALREGYRKRSEASLFPYRP
ncbi:MAG: aminotransferase class IV [Deltaproteobacteria bacterium]|nr:aminotransferase class IV [Deltaproteobacteria bacterium]MBW2021035.1 aminotransferase class IV [Deltaproteobacteria bacterium]MBW2075701.1 aminotransferase class IV [Deltaproteobacteria bacterium]